MNLIEKLGLEKCKAIVEKHRNLGTHFTKFKYYSVKKDDFFLSQLFIDFICLEDLRTTLADHDRIDTCTDIRNHISPNTKVIEHE